MHSVCAQDLVEVMNFSLLSLTVWLGTLCVSIVMLAVTNINKRRLDSMIGNKCTESLEQRLFGLSKSHEDLVTSVAGLKLTIQSILEKL
jgi:hypothetical protein